MIAADDFGSRGIPRNGRSAPDPRRRGGTSSRHSRRIAAEASGRASPDCRTSRTPSCHWRRSASLSGVCDAQRNSVPLPCPSWQTVQPKADMRVRTCGPRRTDRVADGTHTGRARRAARKGGAIRPRRLPVAAAAASPASEVGRLAVNADDAHRPSPARRRIGFHRRLAWRAAAATRGWLVRLAVPSTSGFRRAALAAGESGHTYCTITSPGRSRSSSARCSPQFRLSRSAGDAPLAAPSCGVPPAARGKHEFQISLLGRIGRLIRAAGHRLVHELMARRAAVITGYLDEVVIDFQICAPNRLDFAGRIEGVEERQFKQLLSRQRQITVPRNVARSTLLNRCLQLPALGETLLHFLGCTVLRRGDLSEPYLQPAPMSGQVLQTPSDCFDGRLQPVHQFLLSSLFRCGTPVAYQQRKLSHRRIARGHGKTGVPLQPLLLDTHPLHTIAQLIEDLTAKFRGGGGVGHCLQLPSPCLDRL